MHEKRKNKLVFPLTRTKTVLKALNFEFFWAIVLYNTVERKYFQFFYKNINFQFPCDFL